MRHSIYLIIFLACFSGHCQTQTLDIKMSLLSFVDDEIPADLLSSRTWVILRISSELNRKNWKKQSQDFHRGFLRMGIDPVLYVFEQDFYSNQEVNEAYMKLVQSRKISNLIILDKSNGKFSMVLSSSFDGQGLFRRKKAWRAEALEVNALLFKLGLIVKRSDLVSGNFLTLKAPVFIEDINFFKGSHLATYPGTLRRQKLGVARIDSLRIDTNLPEEQKQLMVAYNKRIKRLNADMEKIFENYPYDWEMFSFKDNDYALASGIQYVFQLVQTSGSGAKDFLNYPDHTKETHIISVTPGNLPGDVRLKRLPVEEVVYKPYIYQARTDDVYVGREWDADTEWESAVRNFFFTLQRQFEE